MQRVVSNLKRFFGKPSGQISPPFKQFNHLNLLSHQDMTELLQFSERRILLGMSPSLSDKKVLVISQPSTDYLIQRIIDSNPESLINYQIDQNGGGGSEKKWTNGDQIFHYTIKGSLKPLAIRPGSFNFVIVPLATQYREELIPLFSQISKTLANSGRLVLSLIHPALEIFLYNQNPASSARARTSLQGYIKALRENDLYLEDLTEGVIDHETKPYFVTTNGTTHFEDFKGIPLVLMLRAVKFIKNES